MIKRTLAATLLTCVATAPHVVQAQDVKQDKVQFIRQLEERQFRSSDLVGQPVYNLDDEDIGDIGDLIMDRNGKAVAVVIDVGGFLGMGVSEVAVPFSALRLEAPAKDTAGDMAARDAALTKRTSPAEETAARERAEAAAESPPDAANRGTGLEDSSATDPGTANVARGNAEVGSADDATDTTLDARIVLPTSRDDLEAAPKLNEDAAEKDDGAADAKPQQ